MIEGKLKKFKYLSLSININRTNESKDIGRVYNLWNLHQYKKKF